MNRSVSLVISSVNQLYQLVELYGLANFRFSSYYWSRLTRILVFQFSGHRYHSALHASKGGLIELSREGIEKGYQTGVRLILERTLWKSVEFWLKIISVALQNAENFTKNWYILNSANG